MNLLSKDILGTKNLQPEEIKTILDTAVSFKEISTRQIKKVPTLRGRTIINLFFEPSTRTRTSFEIAGKRLSADVINISASTSSTVKGESLLDMAYNLQAMSPDILIIRHSVSGVPEMIASHIGCPVINAGDGAHEHPTQALLDLLTIREHFKDLKGLKVAIVGDIAHSRVARSNIFAMRQCGMRVTVVGPPTMIPVGMENLGVDVKYDLREVVPEVDVIMMLRIQLERQDEGLFPSFREYSNLYCLTADKLKVSKKGLLIMHPGPVNRGIEIALEVMEGPHSVILEQVNNGVALRMALMYLLLGGSSETDN
ncbi:MAG: aspartate carbamoyltransferase catalytic subunit [Nitrospinaceae bacterium]|nr:aspartate carbamoyltransferase catalytic subunit [Nitrospinaceae bacterium]NIR56341.1 aspartate carbamoyltransferase catalytic subunit [Nitrospinaceae bacterium]NIS86801.1 aspartate carbamoyltransferase catalytic subunit [Nitrospinaceae bacterium]NIT83635.1 aspartate carbamoyltransferase catalytic subunit [Nitrospinaceae bacterium]NIU45838.1 aspartate carbamoyltransferase catalytic subunit [Nitrospinaceae bacterium]